ncbi:ABC transporter substrate-binding protein [Benzoatithermus flavus]|uniref:Sugar ABC transporter substrate-binding protein n=1 Tax=Benzoatithermus flavus TaxID=3108223 RepID=A0ABU8Y0N9_9PROT
MTRFSDGWTRRSVLAGTTAMVSAAALARPARAAPDWRKFEGASIEVNLVKSPRGEVLQRHLKEFEDLTGITVGLEQIPEQQQRQKAVVELSSGRPSFDVVHLSYHVQKRLFEKGNWLADLGPYLADPSLADPALDTSDFSAAGLAYATAPDGKLHSLPLSVDYWIVYWNKELFEKKGLAYPATFDELVAAAEKLTDPDAGIYGFTARGMKNANVPVWTSFLLGYGVEPVTADGRLQTASPGAIEAARLYQRLLTRSAPPGVAGFNWNECQSAFLQGRIGMWLDGVGFAPPLEDPKKSRVVGKVGYGIVPKGPVAQASATFGDGIGVAAASRNKEAAFLFCQWAVSKTLQADLLQTGSGVPFRKSVIDDPEVRKGVKMPAEWIDAVAGSAKVSRLGLPVVVPVTEFRDIFGIALTNMIGGADPATELERATEQFQPILAKSEAG